VQQACPGLAGAIERAAPEDELDRLVAAGVQGLLTATKGVPPHRAILGCTHFPLVEGLFAKHLPSFTRILPQPEAVADSLEDYLQRHPRYLSDAGVAPAESEGGPLLLTTGNPSLVSASARVFWREVPPFRHLPN
jgi:glutamate racemase